MSKDELEDLDASLSRWQDTPPTPFAMALAISQLTTAVRYQSKRISRLENVLWGTICTVFLALGGAALKIILKV